VTISRATGSLTFPSRFMLVAAMNPCPCGYRGSAVKECVCTPAQIQRYLSRISGPLLDRIDLHLDVPEVQYKELTGDPTGEPSRIIRQRIVQARIIQSKRFSGIPIFCNAQMGSGEIGRHCPLEEETENLLEAAVVKLGFSARAYYRILKRIHTSRGLNTVRLNFPNTLR